jgi:hypothetical protein
MERWTQYDWTANPAERKYREETAWFIEVPVGRVQAARSESTLTPLYVPRGSDKD